MDLGAKFGISVGSDSDSSDAEFAPETEEKDSADSGDEGGDEGEEEEEEEEEEKVEEEEEEVKEKGGVDETVCETDKDGNNGGKEESAKDTSAGGEEKDKDTEMVSEPHGDKEAEGDNGGKGLGESSEQQEYNPLIVRRSNRAIKPTKDVDLYLLGAKFGIDVDGLSGPESSDLEFAPAEVSPGKL